MMTRSETEAIAALIIAAAAVFPSDLNGIFRYSAAALRSEGLADSNHPDEVSLSWVPV
jgi:hypothetical protein